jgi:hypothetical protein
VNVDSVSSVFVSSINRRVALQCSVYDFLGYHRAKFYNVETHLDRMEKRECPCECHDEELADDVE